MTMKIGSLDKNKIQLLLLYMIFFFLVGGAGWSGGFSNSGA